MKYLETIYEQINYLLNNTSSKEMQASNKIEQTNKQNTWASIVYKSLPEVRRQEIDQMHREQLQIQTEERLKEKEKRVKQYEEGYVRRMERKYGLRDTSSGYRRGDFWFFKVEGGKDDSTIARKMRLDTNNQSRFKQYITRKYDNYYSDSWILSTECSEDDCLFLARWRDEHEEKERLDKEESRRNAYIQLRNLENRFKNVLFGLEFGPNLK